MNTPRQTMCERCRNRLTATNEANTRRQEDQTDTPTQCRQKSEASQTDKILHAYSRATRPAMLCPRQPPRFDQNKMAGIRTCATPVHPLPLQERRRGERKLGQEGSRGDGRRPECCGSCVNTAAFRAIPLPQGGKSRRISRPRAGTEGRTRVQCCYVW